MKEKMLEYKSLLKENYELFIDGEWTKSTADETLDVLCPANGEKLATIVEATNEDVDQAIKVAQEALKNWRNVDIYTRSKMILDIADAIEVNAEMLAYVESLDNGKPIVESLNFDMKNCVEELRYFAGLVRSEEGATKYHYENVLTMTLLEPVGVVGQIVPWNFPLMLSIWKIAPALAAGCTIVIHPSSSTPLSLLVLMDLIKDILPKGVINVVTGKGSKSGDYLVKHSGIDKISFTGSTATGYGIAQAGATNLIPVTLELGGKSPVIVFDDVDFEKALGVAAGAILANNGQVCAAGSRLIIHESIHDKFVEALKQIFEARKIGMPWEDDTEQASITSESQLDKILDYIEIAKKEGNTIYCGGQRIVDGAFAKGYFMQPTIITDVKPDDKVAQEEIFGPVLVVIPFKDEQEAIDIANNSDYGLSGAVVTKDISRALRVVSKVQTGQIMVNTYSGVWSGSPFGGYKKSGIGRECYKTIYYAYTQMKGIIIDTNF